MTSPLIRLIYGLLAVCALLVVACDSDDPSCGALGATQACVCTSGAMGAQSCQADGTWGVCECVGGPTDGGSNQDGGADSDAGSDPVPGCVDTDASNYDSAANTDDGSCLYDVTFTVNMTGEVADGELVYVAGDFQDELGSAEWCADCTVLSPMGDDVWSVTVTLPPGTYQYRVNVDGGARTEEVPDACGVMNGDDLNREFVVVDAPLTIPRHLYGLCECSAATCSGANECVSDRCVSRFRGIYEIGMFTIANDRAPDCTSTLMVTVEADGRARFWGEENNGTPGIPSVGSRVVCRTRIVTTGIVDVIMELVPDGTMNVADPNRLVGSLGLIVTLDAGGSTTGSNRIDLPFEGVFDAGTGDLSGMLVGLPQTITVIGVDIVIESSSFQAPSP